MLKEMNFEKHMNLNASIQKYVWIISISLYNYVTSHDIL